MESVLPQARQSLGDILVKVGIITQDQLKTALAQCDPEQRSLGPVLVSMRFATEEKISKAVSISLNVPFFTTFEGLLDPQVGALVPEALARKLLVVPLFQSDGKLTLGMINPLDLSAIDQISALAKMPVQPVMTTLGNMFESISQLYGRQGQFVPQERKLVGGTELEKRSDSVVDVITAMLEEGVSRRASDIHLESGETEVRVRFRIDGMLIDGKTFPKGMDSALAARVKLLARLDITETRLPQDGHIRFDFAGHSIDVRVSTLPTVHGEKIVLRLLDNSRALRRLGELGIEPKILGQFREAINTPNGLVLVTGPTGSGKTTTLYAALAELNKTDRNIVTLEDPVEYVLDRVNQMETFPKIGLTFATGLRAILRQDPNVILVGEIRDLETAEIALQASITGHLVFSTLHTNDAVSSVHRLFNMRVEPFMIAAALRGVLAQRLMRRLCDKCKRPRTLAPEQRAELRLGDSPAEFFEPVGCVECMHTGYSGRFAIHEWFPISKTIREMIVQKVSADALREAAAAEGFVPMRSAALARARAGETSLEEVLRLTQEQVDA